MAWLVRTHRLTLFLHPDAKLDEIPSWEQLTGSEPDTQLSKAGRFHEQGPFQGGQLVAQKQPLRFDLLQTGAPADAGPDADVYIGDLKSARPSFVALANQVLESHVGIQRLAFGCQLACPVAERSEAYELLSDHIAHLELDLKDAQDFLYQINRPRVSEVVQNLKINRLTKWAVVQEEFLTVNTGTGQTVRERLGLSAQIETDISTDGARQEAFPDEQVTPLFSELTQLSDEIGERGDVR